MQRRSKYAAAPHIRSIVANDDGPRTMHVETQRTEGDLLPDITRRVLDRHDQRLSAREGAWSQHTAEARAFRAPYERMTAEVPSAESSRCSAGLEL